MKYRAEIDGLRAVAVLPVILFHAGFELFGGGYLGVDVFFVISGYLITTILIADLNRGRFSIVQFYERRARRILPALFLVTLLCIPFAWFWMLPGQLKDFSGSLVAVNLFASNILFWQQTGYFNSDAEEKPLLHTWSLAVEEQYYLFFPVLLLVLWRFGRNLPFWTIVAMAVISLLISEWGWRVAPGANFYLAPTRAWELLAGSIAAFVVQRHGVRPSNWLAAVGIAAIVSSMFAFDEHTPMPSVYGLIPVGGTVLLVLFSDAKTAVGRLLSARPVVAVGLISYSAYLWHQPMFAFARVHLIGEPPRLLMSALAVAALVFAWLSWRYVEAPFRDKNRISRALVFKLSVVCASAFIVAGILLAYSKDYTDRELAILNVGEYHKTESFQHEWEVGQCYMQGRLNRWKNFDYDQCIEMDEAKANIVLVGDSHAAQLISSLRAYDEIALSVLASGDCRPLLEPTSNANLECLKRNRYFFDSFLNEYGQEIDAVVLAARWLMHEQQEVGELLEHLKSYPFKVVLVGAGPMFATDVPEILVRSGKNLDDANSRVPARYLSWREVANETALKLAATDRAAYLSKVEYFCNLACLIARDGNLLFFDSEHFTPYGADIYVRDQIIPNILH